MLLLSVIFVFIVAFFTIAIVLNTRLISYLFRFRLESFIILLIVRTRLAFSYINLYLLQSIVVIFLGKDLLLSLSISSSLVDTFLFYLLFVDSLIDL